jgi:predicted nuclease of restriction endonuclease-like (RecB) superfamily
MSRQQSLYSRIRAILESARVTAARSVNTAQVISCWLIGHEIVEEEQAGKARAEYGEKLLADLADKFKKDHVPGYSVQNLRYMRQFYLVYPELISTQEIRHAVRGEFGKSSGAEQPMIRHAARGKLPDQELVLAAGATPGKLNPNLSWTHYRTLLRVDKPEARAFYEIETSVNNWSARELERQINSLLFERLALSKDKKGLLKLATRGQEVHQPIDAIKDPVVMEFLGIPVSHRLVESKLEEALINDLQSFLLELGKGFAFVSRQERITLDGDHFYIDLVFYHTILKCYVLIDLKVGKLTHQDLGQLQLYVNYFDRERLSSGDNPSIGLILCTDKNDAVVQYTLGEGQSKRLFASRYKLYLPTKAELRAEMKRELRCLSPEAATHIKQTKPSRRKTK